VFLWAIQVSFSTIFDSGRRAGRLKAARISLENTVI
jgi:hypothetical protein